MTSYFKENPWLQHYNGAHQRCTNKNHIRYERYGGRGIKFNMRVKDFKELWFRDKAYEMNKPSVDRINNDGNYELNNCRFIEHSLNVKLGRKIGGGREKGFSVSNETKLRMKKSAKLVIRKRNHLGKFCK